MPNGLTYTSFVTLLAKSLVVQSVIAGDTADDPDFLTYLPAIIDAAELRISRELDPLVLRKDVSNLTTAALFNWPADMVVLREAGYYTPVGSTPATGTWNTLEPLQPSALREFFPLRTVTGPPKYLAHWDDVQGALGPAPDAAYALHLFYTYRLTPLAASPSGATSNWLSTNVPDLYLNAALVAANGFLKNYGALADDPQAPMTWEKRYQVALASAREEEKRRRLMAAAQDPASNSA